MAKRLPDGTFKPGIIYELRVHLDGVWAPFYVGETTRPRERRAEHNAGARNADERVVYDTIRVFNDNQIEWDLFQVDRYGAEGPTDMEDEHVMNCVLKNYWLANMQKGNSAWVEARKAEAEQMKITGYTSVREYRKAKAKWDSDAELAKTVAKQAQWVEEVARAEKLTASQKKMKDYIANASKEVQTKKAEQEERKRLKSERARQYAEELAALRKKQEAEWAAEELRKIDAVQIVDDTRSLFGEGHKTNFGALFAAVGGGSNK